MKTRYPSVGESQDMEAEVGGGGEGEGNGVRTRCAEGQERHRGPGE